MVRAEPPLRVVARPAVGRYQCNTVTPRADRPPGGCGPLVCTTARRFASPPDQRSGATNTAPSCCVRTCLPVGADRWSARMRAASRRRPTNGRALPMQHRHAARRRAPRWERTVGPRRTAASRRRPTNGRALPMQHRHAACGPAFRWVRTVGPHGCAPLRVVARPTVGRYPCNTVTPRAPRHPSSSPHSTDQTHPPLRSSGRPAVPGCARRHSLLPPAWRSAGWCHPSG